MKKWIQHTILFLLLIVSTESFATDKIQVNHLKCEMLTDPQVIDIITPRFSWQINTTERGIKQLAYQVIVASSLALLDKNQGDVWNSGKVSSEQSINVTYVGKPLQSRNQYFWKVQVWSNNKEVQWSNPAHFSMGLLKQTDWKA